MGRTPTRQVQRPGLGPEVQLGQLEDPQRHRPDFAGGRPRISLRNWLGVGHVLHIRPRPVRPASATYCFGGEAQRGTPERITENAFEGGGNDIAD